MLISIVEAIRLTRPLNWLSTLLITLLGGYLGGGLGQSHLYLAALVVATLTASGILTNDYFDIDTDRINKPSRPLPSGQISPRTAELLAFVLGAIGIALSAFLGVVMALIAGAMVVLSVFYSQKIKRFFLLGNLLISGMSAFTVVYGGMAVGNLAPTLVPALQILLFMLCREIIKTVEDYDGDYVQRTQTIAVVWGTRKATYVSAALVLVIIPVSLLPWFLGYMTVIYPLILVPTVDAILLIATFGLLAHPGRRTLRIFLAATKGVNFLWLGAMFIGARSLV